jgi:peptidoglycan/LPS O-acetylase OafA/YrhL
VTRAAGGELCEHTKGHNTWSMPALLKFALIVALVLLVVGLVVKAVQFLLYVGLVVLVGAGVLFFARRARITR